MTCHIIGLGETAKQWNGEGFSIGVNDCFRHGKPTDHLILVNSLRSTPERQNIVAKSNPEILWSNMSCWTSHPSFKPLGQTFHWKGKFVPGNLYHSNNSPFIAVTLAYRLGYRTMILWGVDLNTHKTIRKDNGMLEKALKDFKTLQGELLKNGASMYLGVKGSALALPLWK